MICMSMAEMIPEVQRTGFGAVVGCAAGPKSKPEELKKVCGHVVALDTMDGHSFQSFFKWVSSAVSGGNVSMGAVPEMTLPPPPPEVNVVC